jgi:BirA family biotin operon repressor/biotin-[acetyl-CoA-carboxylase] ligase
LRIGTEVTFLETVDSTNEFIRKNINSLKNGAVVWAQTQTEGRGRLKRNWISDDNGNIYFSFLMKDRKWIKQLTELPIIVSVVQSHGP